jgi:hypothetical protein
LRLTFQIALALICLTASLAIAQTSAPEALFPGVPFERWLAEGERSQIRWTARVTTPHLSNYQRIEAGVEIQLDGAELVKRRAHGQLVILIGLKDQEQHVYRTHQAIDLQKVEDTAANSNIIINQPFFVLPGDYQVLLGVFDAGNQEHAALQRTLHVPALRNDPLPEAWKDLPPVEIFEDPPGELFLPSMTGRLHLPLDNKRRVDIELLVNTSRSTAGVGPRAGQMTASTLGEVIPGMKVVSQIAVRDGTLKIAVLDLARRKVIFEKDAQALDWPALRSALTEADPNVIDVHALEDRKQDAQFFVRQMSRRIESESVSDTPHVILVLSGPMSFAAGADLHPIQLSEKPNTRIYYFRYHAPPVRVTPAEAFERSTRGRRSRGDPLGGAPIMQQNESLDSLGNLLKPLHPRLFDIYTPEQFRKALSVMLEEVSRL